MATINRKEIDFTGLSFIQIGKKIVEVSGKADGIGIFVRMTQNEHGIFSKSFGLSVGRSIGQIVGDAVKKAGHNPGNIKWYYDYQTLIFSTERHSA